MSLDLLSPNWHRHTMPSSRPRSRLAPSCLADRHAALRGTNSMLCGRSAILEAWKPKLAVTVMSGNACTCICGCGYKVPTEPALKPMSGFSV
eukprot:359920-Chlamydomonas_euryale.AAC.4